METDFLYKKCSEIIKKYYSDIIYPNVYYDALEIYLLNHICRVCLQKKDIRNVLLIIEVIIAKQNSDGGWGYDNTKSYAGITSTEIQLLLWTKYLLETIDIINNLPLKESIVRGLNYLLSRREWIYWIDSPTEKSRVHGLIDLNHYIAQVLFYAKRLKINDKRIDIYLADLYSWYCKNQGKDGGWHEIAKVRSRVGVTADAVRAFLPNKQFKNNIESGVEYIINNQHCIEGYWDAGNHDKCYDALKTIIASLHLLDNYNAAMRSINKGLMYILHFDISTMDIEEKSDYLTVLLGYLEECLTPKSERLFF